MQSCLLSFCYARCLNLSLCPIPPWSRTKGCNGNTRGLLTISRRGMGGDTGWDCSEASFSLGVCRLCAYFLFFLFRNCSEKIVSHHKWLIFEQLSCLLLKWQYSNCWLFGFSLGGCEQCKAAVLAGNPTSSCTVNKNLPVPVTVHVLKPDVLLFILLHVLLYLCLKIFPSSPRGRTIVPLERCCLESSTLFVFSLCYGIPGPPFPLWVSKTHLTMVGHKGLFNWRYHFINGATPGSELRKQQWNQKLWPAGQWGSKKERQSSF